MHFFTKIFKKYKPNHKYWINLSEIKILPSFEKTPPKPRKMKEKYDYYNKTGKFHSPIILDKQFYLVDGYTSYIIAKNYKINKVPVYFVD